MALLIELATTSTSPLAVLSMATALTSPEGSLDISPCGRVRKALYLPSVRTNVQPSSTTARMIRLRTSAAVRSSEVDSSSVWGVTTGIGVGIATGGGIVRVALGAGAIVGVGVAIGVAVGVCEAQAANAASNEATIGRVVTRAPRILRARGWVSDGSLRKKSAGPAEPTDHPARLMMMVTTTAITMAAMISFFMGCL
ncbi:MAG: hypothetical protein OXL97_08260 [Chloroflexota bacterium]|nr:hypothetical protein [Chloroflexota bacterium]MDE2885724.1 hypothetical protein [Chloroflexota bacterium]